MARWYLMQFKQFSAIIETSVILNVTSCICLRCSGFQFITLLPAFEVHPPISESDVQEFSNCRRNVWDRLKSGFQSIFMANILEILISDPRREIDRFFTAPTGAQICPSRDLHTRCAHSPAHKPLQLLLQSILRPRWRFGAASLQAPTGTCKGGSSEAARGSRRPPRKSSRFARVLCVFVYSKFTTSY